ncbi:MAG: hypothetical protein AAGA77_01830, partial [Bacteroidota bacterium]
DPLAIRIERLNDEVLWKENRIIIYNGDDIFVDITDFPGDFRKDSITLEFPHTLFHDSFNGPLSLKIRVLFFENAMLEIEGSVYYYQCEDINEDFELQECRWPEQITGSTFLNPC